MTANEIKAVLAPVISDYFKAEERCRQSGDGEAANYYRNVISVLMSTETLLTSKQRRYVNRRRVAIAKYGTPAAN